MFRSFFLISSASLFMSSQVAATSKETTSECYLLELAYRVTEAQNETAYSDILVDCPGYESWNFEMSTREYGLAVRNALSATKPEKVKAGTETATLLFQRMIKRGVPVDIAQGIVETRAFDKAVAALER